MFPKTTAICVSSACLLLASPARAWDDNQACVDRCLTQADKLRCLRECSAADVSSLRKGKVKPLPQSEPAELEEADFLGQMMAQAAAACKQGNKQACRNLAAMRAGK